MSLGDELDLTELSALMKKIRPAVKEKYGIKARRSLRVCIGGE